MKYVLAILAIIVEFFIYAAIGGALGWKAGGGVLPMLLSFAVYGATWRAITKKRDSDSKEDENK